MSERDRKAVAKREREEKRRRRREVIARSATFELEDQLPSLPVPDLHSTLKSYIEALEPLVSHEQLEKTKRTVAQFEADGGEGAALQRTLLKRREECARAGKSWLEDWWFRYGYLAWPQPLPINSSVGILLEGIKSGAPQLLQAARVIHATAAYAEKVKKGAIPIETMSKGSVPLTMDQYSRLFTTYRMPHAEGGDTLEVLEAAQSAVVISNKRFYLLHLTRRERDGSESALCVRDLEAQLSKIHAQSHSSPDVGVGLGMLTSDERPVWGANRSHLQEISEVNRASLRAIETALFVIALDPATSNGSLDIFYHHTLSGDAAYRWYDKGFNWIVYSDGKVGMNAEHTPSEATVPEQICEDVLEMMERTGPYGYPDSDAIPCGGGALEAPSELVFEVDDTIRGALSVAKRKHEQARANLDVSILYYHGFGTSFLKKMKVSPDAFTQMVLQLAYTRTHGAPTSTYETGQTRMFRNGRTDTVRPCSMESVAMCDAMLEKNGVLPWGDKAKLIRRALAKASERMKVIVQGKGFDRHMLGMRIAAMENNAADGTPIPELFQDASYKILNTFKLSTSNVPINRLVNGGFGPVNADGYGVCYQLVKDFLVFNITALKSSKESNVQRLRLAIERSIIDLAEALWRGEARASL